MKNILTFICTILFLQISFAQIDITSADQNVTCGSSLSFTDSGGAGGDYPNSQDETITICPSDPTKVVQIDITSISLETCCDDLGLYNGSGTGTAIDDDVTATGTFTSTAAGDCMTIWFDSDGSVVDAGWEATITCTDPPVDPCTAADAPADNCANATLLALTAPFSGTTDCGYTVDDAGGSCGSLDNNSWFQFVAGATDVEIDWSINGGSSCSGGAGSAGIQLGVMEGTCGSLTNVGSNCVNPTGGIGSSGTFNMTGLIQGNTYYLQIDGFAGDLCEYTITPVSGIVTSCSAVIGADVSTNVEYCFGETPGPIGTDASYDDTGFDAGPNATASAAVVFAEICGTYDAANNTTLGDPTTNTNYTGFLVAQGYSYQPGTAAGLDGEGTNCDFITLVPITVIDGSTDPLLLDGAGCIATGAPFTIDFRPEITATYDCGTETLSVAGGAQDDTNNAVAGEYTVTGDIAGTTTSAELASAGITADGSYNISVTDSDGCTQAITLAVTGCPAACGAVTPVWD